MPTRTASATWDGGIKGGTGHFTSESGALDGRYSFGSRFEQAGGSNPEELLAAAEAACFSMALSGNLERSGMTPQKIETKAACTVEKQGDGFTITTLKLTVRATVPGADPQKFQEVATKTKETCPVSRALKGVDIQLDAALA